MTRRFAEEIVDSAQLWLLLGIPGIPLAIWTPMSAMMMSAAPGADRLSLSTYVLIASIMSFPLACFISISRSRQTLRAGASSIACAWAILPLANIAIFAVILAWIQWVQHGRVTG